MWQTFWLFSWRYIYKIIIRLLCKIFTREYLCKWNKKILDSLFDQDSLHIGFIRYLKINFYPFNETFFAKLITISFEFRATKITIFILNLLKLVITEFWLLIFQIYQTMNIILYLIVKNLNSKIVIVTSGIYCAII